MILLTRCLAQPGIALMTRSSKPSGFRRVLLTGAQITGAALLLAVMIFASTAWRVQAYDVDWEGAHADAAIVLGASAYHHRPSPVFRERIRHAINLFHSGRVSRLIFTGGKAPGSAYSEAEVARRFVHSLFQSPRGRDNM
jgi:vancomycin permeability regulator SanA